MGKFDKDLLLYVFYLHLIASIALAFILSKNSVRGQIAYLSLRKKQKKLLKRYFPSTLALPENAMGLIEERIDYYLHAKRFSTHLNEPLDHIRKFLIATYIAHITYKLENFRFINISNVVVYPDRFYSTKVKKSLSWEIIDHKTLAISWKHLCYDIDNFKNSGAALGIRILAYVLYKENGKSLKEQLYEISKANNLDKQAQYLIEKHEEKYYLTCLTRYFSQPKELEQELPLVFNRIHQIMVDV